MRLPNPLKRLRKKTAQPQPLTDPQPVQACSQCHAPFTWRDTAYTPKASALCKRCHQHAKRVQARGHYAVLFDAQKQPTGIAIFRGENRALRRAKHSEARLKVKHKQRKQQDIAAYNARMRLAA